MTVNDLILIEDRKVRSSPSLMAFYKQAFFETFGHNPVCTGCTFSTDWQKLVRKINGSENKLTIENKNIMSTFKLKKVQNKIFAYRKDGQTVRRYDNFFDENFVIGFLTNGTPEQIEERKKLFSVLPEAVAAQEELTPTMNNTDDEIDAVAKNKGVDVSDVKTKQKKINKIKKAGNNK